MNDASDLNDDEVVYEKRGRVAYVTINRPSRMNALSRSVLGRIVEVMSDTGADPDVWLVVIAGAGDRAFSTGADLKERAQEDTEGRPPTTPMLGAGRNAFEAVLETPKPTIASINGYCLAGGFELALACDLRIASDDAMFGMPEAKIGMGANFASVLLPRLLPRAVAMELLYLAERIDAARALSLGLLNRVVPKGELSAATDALVGQLLAMAPLSLQRYKEMAVKGWELPVHSALRLNVGPNPYTSRDRVEGIKAFLEKRDPVWEGR